MFRFLPVAMLLLTFSSSPSFAAGDYAKHEMQRLYADSKNNIPDVGRGLQSFLGLKSLTITPKVWAPDYKDWFIWTADKNWAHFTFTAVAESLNSRASMDCEGWVDPRKRLVMVKTSKCAVDGDASLIEKLTDTSEVPF